MLRRIFVVGLWLAAACSASTDPAYREVLDKYCVTCHNQRLKTGGLVLDTMDIGKVPAQAEVWEKVIRKVAIGHHASCGNAAPRCGCIQQPGWLA